MPAFVTELLNFFVPWLVSEAEKLFGKSVSGAVDAANQDLTNTKYQWVLDAIAMDIFPSLEKRCPSWVTPDLEAVKPLVLELVTAELNKLPAS